MSRSHGTEHFYRLGLCYVALQRDEKAITAFAKTLKLNLEHADALEQAGLVLSRMEKYEESIALFTGISTWTGQASVSCTEKGCAYFALKKFGEALSSFDLAIESDSNHIGSLVKKGQSLSELKRYEEAVNSLTGSLPLTRKMSLPILSWVPIGKSFPGTRMRS